LFFLRFIPLELFSDLLPFVQHVRFTRITPEQPNIFSRLAANNQFFSFAKHAINTGLIEPFFAATKSKIAFTGFVYLLKQLPAKSDLPRVCQTAQN
jgi:hypothetical protein